MNGDTLINYKLAFKVSFDALRTSACLDSKTLKLLEQDCIDALRFAETGPQNRSSDTELTRLLMEVRYLTRVGKK